MKSHSATRRRAEKPLAFCLLIALITLLLSACGGNPQTQQQSSQSKQALDKDLVHAQSIGVPASLLKPIIQQEQQLAGTHAPLGLFGNQSINDYYQNLTLRYMQLDAQVAGLAVQETQQTDYQASQDLQTMSNALAERQGQNLAQVQVFSTQLTNYQQELAKAQYPKEYLQISASAQSSTQALHLMGPAHDALLAFQKLTKQLKSSHIDVTAFNQEAQDDQQSFNSASTAADFTKLTDLINTQINETTTVSTVAIPYVGQVKLDQFKADIQLIQKYNGTNVSKYQQRLQTDQQSLDNAKTVSDFLHISAKIDADIASIQLPLIQAQANYLLKQFHQEVTSWGKSHQYANKYDGQSYQLDYEYDEQGIGSDADAAVQSAVSLDDYHSAIDLINNDMLNLQMMEKDYSDTTAYNKPHQTDFTLNRCYATIRTASLCKRSTSPLVSMLSHLCRATGRFLIVKRPQPSSRVSPKARPYGIPTQRSTTPWNIIPTATTSTIAGGAPTMAKAPTSRTMTAAATSPSRATAVTAVSTWQKAISPGCTPILRTTRR